MVLEQDTSWSWGSAIKYVGLEWLYNDLILLAYTLLMFSRGLEEVKDVIQMTMSQRTLLTRP